MPEPAGEARGAALLETDGISVTFGGLKAVDDASVRVGEGQLVGLIGPNGAGKTTFIDALTGFVPLSAGRIVFDGHELQSLPAHRRARKGLSRTFQSLELFEDLTVRENLLVAAERPSWWTPLADLVVPERRRDVRGVDWALSLLELDDAAERVPGELSHGQRKLVGVARALAANPRLVLLDEPAAGLDTAESEQLGLRLRGMLDHGVTVLLVDHDMGLVLSVCDRITVLEFGRVIAEGPPSAIRGDDRVIGAYLGEAARREKEEAARTLADLATAGGTDGGPA